MSHAFSLSQAEQIPPFVDALPLSVLSLVVHCEGGYSRSCAVAYVLQELHGYAAELERLQNANPSVIKVLRKAVAAHTKKIKVTYECWLSFCASVNPSSVVLRIADIRARSTCKFVAWSYS